MLITFEGPDGGGKSTQLALLAEFLSQQGHSVFETREPGGTDIGEQIREVLHNLENQNLVPRAEILLYSASRAQIVDEAIRPRLKDGQIVICDRFYDSTFAYQGYGHGLDLDILRRITAFATNGLTPDLTLYFDINPGEGLKRRQSDDDAEWNRLDNYALAFHQRVYDGYRELISQEPDRWVVIDANRPVDIVQADVCKHVLERLNQ